MSNIKRGDTVVLHFPAERVWIKKTRDELDAEREADKRAGRWCDDGGEPILYGPYKGAPEGCTSMSVVVTSMRGKWEHWRNKPKFLRTGWCAFLEREVMFVAL